MCLCVRVFVLLGTAVTQPAGSVGVPDDEAIHYLRSSPAEATKKKKKNRKAKENQLFQWELFRRCFE